jgi:ADP-heptose:LPS heptosyltransferase
LDFQFKLKKHKFNQVINISNESHLEIDKLLTHIGANETISNNNDFLKFESEEKLKVKYSKIVNENKLDEKIEHLFITSKHFFERLIEDKITITKPSYTYKSIVNESNTLIIFPDNQTVYQKWSKENYISLIKKLTQKLPNIELYIISLNATNQILCEVIKKESSITLKHIHNPAFVDLANLMSSANVLLGNDSVFAHIAAAINKNYICLSNGQFLNKSMPYPVEMNVPQVMVYPAELETELLKNEKAKYYFYKQSKIDINFISVDNVMNVILNQYNH